MFPTFGLNLTAQNETTECFLFVAVYQNVNRRRSLISQFISALSVCSSSLALLKCTTAVYRSTFEFLRLAVHPFHRY